MGLFKQDLTSILAGFQRTIQRLEKLADRNTGIIGFNAEVANNLHRENQTLSEEREKALAIKQKLEALVA